MFLALYTRLSSTSARQNNPHPIAVVQVLKVRSKGQTVKVTAETGDSERDTVVYFVCLEWDIFVLARHYILSRARLGYNFVTGSHGERQAEADQQKINRMSLNNNVCSLSLPACLPGYPPPKKKPHRIYTIHISDLF